MEHELTASIELSAAPHGGREALASMIPRLAEEALGRTLGNRGKGELTKWGLRGSTITATLSSEGARPHQALLALTRRLGEELGKRDKIGVRSVRLRRYRIGFEVEESPIGPVTLPLPHTLKFDGKQAELTLKDLPEQSLRDNWPDRAVSLVLEKIRRQHYQGKGEYWALLTQSPAREARFQKDPTEEMLSRHWIKSGPTKGRWFLGPQAAHLMRTMERLAREEVLEPLGFKEIIQPHHDNFETLLKTGHLEGLPGEFYYLVEPRSRDTAVWQKFTDLVAITHQVPLDELAAQVTSPVAVSCYAQCPTVYWWLQGRTLATESLPLLVYDRTAISNRYESGGRHGLERVDEFHRVEPVFIGTPQQLLELREKLLTRYARVLNDILEIEWRSAWVTPFYMAQSGETGIEDETERIKGTIDFEAYLPYRGPREKADWLEFQNLSIVGEKYTKAFTIKGQKGPLWSGCSGIGLERWLVAFLSQKGLDAEGWPEGFRRVVGGIPAGVGFL